MKTNSRRKKMTAAALALVMLLTFVVPSLTFASSAAAPTSYSSISAGGSASVSSASSSYPRYFKFVPTVSGIYEFYSSNCSGDPKASLLSSSGSSLATDDDGGSGSNFSISYSCTAGTTYYIQAYAYSGSASYTLYVSLVTSTSANTSEPLETVGGTNTYQLFNSGRTGNGKKYSSSLNPAPNSLTNNGYDIYATDYSSMRTVPLGLSFTVNSDVTEIGTLTIYAFDVDEGSGERDLIYLVDETAGTRTKLDGYLKGRDQEWNTTTMRIAPSLFQTGHTYHFELYDSVSGWVVYVRNVALQLTTGGGGPDLNLITSHDFSATISNSGLVSTSLSLATRENVTFSLEYAASVSGDQRGSALNQSISVTPSGASKNVSFQLESGSPKGNYQIDVIIKNASGGIVASYTIVAGYAYSTVSYDANGGSNNLPLDTNAYSSGNTVTVLFDYVPSKAGSTFLGWSTSRTASTPQYTQNGNKTFTIGSSDVVLYAVWGTHTHTEGAWTVDRAPTCLLGGSKHVNCSDCGERIRDEYIPATGHDYRLADELEATCTTDGYREYTCHNDGCNATKRQTLLAHGHDFGSDHVCDECGYERVIHTHTYTEQMIAPTCTAVGYSLHTCSCGDSYRDNYVDQHGHRWDDGEITLEKTCTTDGTVKYTCDTCGATNTVAIAAGHDWTETVTVRATCTTDGTLTRVCNDCNETETEVIPAAHTWDVGTVVTPATCTTEGSKRCTCTVCGETDTLPIPVLGHRFQNGICTVCGARIPDIVTPDTDHPEYGMYFEIDDILSAYGPDYINEYGVLLDYNSGATLKKVAVYLTQDGTMWRRCIACVGEGITYATYVPYLSYDQDIKYTGLNSSWINIFSLRENSYGVWCYSDYATIGVNLEDKEGNLLLSLYDIGQAGAKTRIFDDLDEMIAWLTEDSDCINHTEGTWIVDESATCGREGSRHTECSVCGIRVREEVIPATGNHTEGVWIIDEPVTCTEDGSKHTECTVCGVTVHTETILATGRHSESDWIIDSNPTCTVDGGKHTECTVCGWTIQVAILSATGHDESDWIIDEPATCTENGSKHTQCLVCGDTIQEEEIVAPGYHEESDWIVDVAPTVMSSGERHKECLVCQEELVREIMPVLARIVVEDVSTKAGATVTVKLDVQNNPGILGAVLTLDYDPALTLLDVQAGGAWRTLELTKPAAFTTPCNFVWDGGNTADNTDGTIIVLTFKVPDNAAIDTVYDIGVSYTDGNILNSAFEHLTVVIDNGTIVVDELMGDVNDDGVVNVADVITLRRYMAGGYNVTIIEEQADMNADGEITVADIILLRRYITDGE